jgi:uncharacterized protein
MRVAVIGSGISGLGLAHALNQADRHDSVVYEKDKRLGGHSHTVDVKVDGRTIAADTGFLVFNDRTYPRLIDLFNQLSIHSTASDMSFAVRNDASGLEWAGTNLASLFADKRNLIRFGFWRMLYDIIRFNREATALAVGRHASAESLGAYLQRNGYSATFNRDYLLPMAACIWSAPKAEILAFPLSTFVHFFHNHGLLAVTNRPQWRTVTGGARNYVNAIAKELPDIRVDAAVSRVERDENGVTVYSQGSSERFDAVAFACHSDEALALLAEPSAEEAAALSAIAYQPNVAYLHTDASLMPKRKTAWSAWNYLVLGNDDGADDAKVSLTYWLNKLQPLACRDDVFVTLNPAKKPAESLTHRIIEYSHPLLNAKAVAAQATVEALQGKNRTYYAGAWLGYGFHEDGLASGQRVAERLNAL